MTFEELLSVFKKLPAEVQDYFNAEKTLALIDEIYNHYPQNKAPLAKIVMRLAVNDADFNQLPNILERNYLLTREYAEGISRELKEKIFEPFWSMTNKSQSIPNDREGAELTTETPNETNKSVFPTSVLIDYEGVVRAIFDQVGLKFTDEFLRNRFKNIVISYLKDIRDELETRTVLKRPQKIGGTELDEATVDKIIEILKTQKPRLKIESGAEPQRASLSDGLTDLKEMVNISSKKTQDYEAPLTTSERRPEEKEPEELAIDGGAIIPAPSILPEKKEEATGEIIKFETGPLSPPLPSVTIQPTMEEKKEVQPESAPLTGSDDITKIADELAKEETTAPLSPIPEISLDAPPVLSQEPKMTAPTGEEISRPLSAPPPAKETTPQYPSNQLPDYPISIHRPPIESAIPVVDLSATETVEREKSRSAPKVYGPIDELRAMRLEDWRRFGGVKAAVDRIIDKINLLAEESFLKKAEGIRAWKESEINRIYLEIGTEAIDATKSVEEVIRDRIAEKRVTLTLDEFNAVAELNQKLRF